MRIELPEKYCFEKKNCYAKIDDNGILKIRGKYSFRNIMYDITFRTKEKKCIYCGSIKEITLDHLYPQSRGGPTIPSNLEPCCRRCNTEKDDLNVVEYEFYLNLSSPEKRKEFKKDVKTANDIMEKWNWNLQAMMPEEWFTEIKFEQIKFVVDKEEVKTKNGFKYGKIKKFYKETKKFKDIIVLDRNNVLMYGYETYLCSKSLNLSEIRVIKLENVEIVF